MPSTVDKRGKEGDRIGTHPLECKRPCGGRGNTLSRLCHAYGGIAMARNRERRRRQILQAQLALFGVRWIDGTLAFMQGRERERAQVRACPGA